MRYRYKVYRYKTLSDCSIERSAYTEKDFTFPKDVGYTVAGKNNQQIFTIPTNLGHMLIIREDHFLFNMDLVEPNYKNELFNIAPYDVEKTAKTLRTILYNLIIK